jgi:FkbH-like protein
MLDWLPDPPDFGAQYRALGSLAGPERLDRLISLSQYRLGFLELIQLSRQLDSLATGDVASLPRARLALLGSSTLEHLIPAIRVAALRRRLWMDVYCGGYGLYRQEVIDPDSGLHRFRPDTVLFSVATCHAAPAVEPGASETAVRDQIYARINDFRSLWKHARETLKASIVHQTFLPLAEPLFGSFDRLVAASPWSVIEQLNAALATAANADHTALLDIARVSQQDGQDAWHDVTRMLQAKQEIAPHAAPAYGELLVRIIAAERGMSKKCLVLDLDNTIWGGVLGDDGMQGLVLGQGSALGEAHLGVQQYAKQLKDRGVILAVCSKNDAQIAEHAFANHPEMLLKRSDVSDFVANWSDKVENLPRIAQRLNIGLDSLVLLDDNPAERQRVRMALPVVAVPELPDDVAGYVRRLAAAGYFEATSFTPEDRIRSASYADDAARTSLMSTSQSMDEYLHELRMLLDCGPFAPVDLPRIIQLINKTNQFTPTTRRYSAEQVASCQADSQKVTLQFRLADRFGDNGLVSAMILCPVDGTPDTLCIDTWVMSCRVFGRQLELEAMNVAAEAAKSRGVRFILASYTETAKNGVIRDLYPRLGFDAVTLPVPGDGTTHWTLNLAKYKPFATKIIRRSAEA